MNNPIFLRIKDNLSLKHKKNVSLFMLLINLISVLVYALSSIIFYVVDDSDIVINVACISFVLLVLFTMYLSYKSFKGIFFYIVYPILLGLSLSTISLATYNLLNKVFSYSLILFILTASILLINLTESVLYYIKGFTINHFFYKLIFASLVVLLINGVILLIILKRFSSVYFIYLIVSLISLFIYGFVLTMYFEEIKKLWNRIDDKYSYDLGILVSTLTLYFLPELFHYLFKKREKEEEK